MLEDFAIFDDFAYSLELIKTFKRGDPLGNANSLGRLIMNYVDDQMLNRRKIPDMELKQQLIVVSHGKIDHCFAHASCFVRYDYHNMKKRITPQLLLLDCKNSIPLYYP